MRRRVRFIAVVSTAALLAQPGVTAAADEPAPGLSTQDRALVAAAGDRTVTLLVAAGPGKAGQVGNQLERLGGTVRYRDADLDYLRVTLPATKAVGAARLTDVDAAGLDRVVRLDDPVVTGDMPPLPITAPDANTPADNPYLPVGDIGAAQFVADHPRWDGRGTRIGVIDSGIDITHPAFATTTTGRRKVVDWISTHDPVTGSEPTWVPMGTTVRGRTFTVDGVEYTAPSGGRFKFGLFDERNRPADASYAGDVNRDGNPPGSSGLFGVLWDGGRRVWVDTDQDHSFADQPGMRPYKERFDVGRFGVDNPATPMVDQVPFVVQIDRDREFVNLGIAAHQHGSHVAAIAVGHRILGGAMSGAAPGAEMVSVQVCDAANSCPFQAINEGAIYAAKVANVDVINMSIGNQLELNDGNSPATLLYNRITARYGVQFFFSAGNAGPGGNTVNEMANGSELMSVGSYISDATWRENFGSVVPFADNLHPFSNRGPREDGGFKPDLVAAGAAVSATLTWQPGGPSLFPLPPGYGLLNGTSMASPAVSGAAALLISAAKEQGIGHSPAQLRQALRSSARFLPRYGAYEQGAGLADVAGAYQLLRQGLRPVDISTRVPVKTVLSHLLPTPDVGAGIHDREGVTVGEPYTRTYTVTRTSGPSRPITYQLSWTGNDGTFSVAPSIRLPRGTAVSLPVDINPATPGAHSALLRFDDPATPAVEFQRMNTVIAPHEFAAANGYATTISGTIGRNQARQYFVRIPPGTPSFTVDFSGPSATPGTGQARFLRFHPHGLPIETTVVGHCYSPPPPGGFCENGTPFSRTLTNPAAGVWELTVEARRTSDLDFTPFTLTASIPAA